MQPEAIPCLCTQPAACLPEDEWLHPSPSQAMRWELQCTACKDF